MTTPLPGGRIERKLRNLLLRRAQRFCSVLIGHTFADSPEPGTQARCTGCEALVIVPNKPGATT